MGLLDWFWMWYFVFTKMDGRFLLCFIPERTVQTLWSSATMTLSDYLVHLLYGSSNG